MKNPSLRHPFTVFVVLAVVATGCGKGGSSTDESSSGCTRKDEERAAKAVLRCTEKSVAYVQTDVASGTGVVIDVSNRRYVLTNEHVVDPFDSADATIAGTSYDDLPVLGVDVSSDIALLGPLTGSKRPDPLTISDGTKLERGDEVFLVGFPGEANRDDLSATIAGGIVSRIREVKEFKQAFIQTDASIGGGQSGGPLFDASARLVGISGLSFADQFALALTGRDAKAAIQRIVKGGGDRIVQLPSRARPGAGTTAGSLRITDGSDNQVLYLPASSDARTWHLTVDLSSRAIASAEQFGEGEVLAVSANTVDVQKELVRQLAKARGGRPQDLFDPSAIGQDPKLAKRETAPGVFAIPVPADESALVVVGAPLTDAPLNVAWQSDLRLVQASKAVPEETIEVGGQVDHTFSSFDTGIDVLVGLSKGQKVQLHARSPQGDPGFDVFGPDKKLDHITMADPQSAGVETIDDTQDGLYGIDAKSTFEAVTAGTYRFRVYSNDINTVALRFSVEDCAKAKCDDRKKKSG